MTNKTALFSLFVLLSTLSFSPALARQNDHKLNAVLYQQRSSEYLALVYQAFNTAQRSLEESLKTLPSEKKGAVIVDVDETVLSNAPYEADLIISGQSYPVGYEEWMLAAQGSAVPGAVDFLRYASSRGVRVFYVTNRKAVYAEATRANLKKAGFPDVSEETVLVRTETNSKEPRREAIRKNHEILLLIGDNLLDLSQDFEVPESNLRKEQVEKQRAQLGSRFIVLPNAIYGDWEAVSGDLNGKTPEEKRMARLKALEPFKQKP